MLYVFVCNAFISSKLCSWNYDLWKLNNFYDLEHSWLTVADLYVNDQKLIPLLLIRIIYATSLLYYNFRSVWEVVYFYKTKKTSIYNFNFKKMVKGKIFYIKNIHDIMLRHIFHV